MYTTQDFRTGLKIEYEGEPYTIVEFQHVKPGKGGAFVRTKIKNLITGRVLDPTFKSGDKVGKPDMQENEMQFLYQADDMYTFMDTNNYEQVMISREDLGDTAKWLQENCVCDVLFWNNRSVGVSLPNFVVLKIINCEPGVRGDTAQGATKPAELESGATVQVPLFVNEGESIKIDTRTGSYVERVS